MKRILCAVLIIFALPACFFSCKGEPGFPETAETLYPIVEGQRIPFKVLFVSESNLTVDHFVLRNKGEAQAAMNEAFFQQLNSEQSEILLSQNYDVYQVVGVTTQTNSSNVKYGVTEVRELINDGDFVAVYATDRPDGNYVESDDLRNFTTVMLIKKADYDFSAHDDYLNIPVVKKLCYSLYPDRVL